MSKSVINSLFLTVAAYLGCCSSLTLPSEELICLARLIISLILATTDVCFITAYSLDFPLALRTLLLLLELIKTNFVPVITKLAL